MEQAASYVRAYRAYPFWNASDIFPCSALNCNVYGAFKHEKSRKKKGVLYHRAYDICRIHGLRFKVWFEYLFRAAAFNLHCSCLYRFIYGTEQDKN